MGCAHPVIQSYRADDPRIFFSPYTWYENEDACQTNQFGAYFHTRFDGSEAWLEYDNSYMASDFEINRWVDGVHIGPIPVPRTERSVHLYSGPTGRHAIKVGFARSTERTDRWSGLGSSLRVRGVRFDGELFPAEPAPRRMLFYGDSIGEGFSNAHWAATTIAYEYGNISFAGRGFVESVDPAIPPLVKGWTSYDSRKLRMIEPVPDLTMVNLGVNDSFCRVRPWRFRLNVRSVLKAIRQATGACPLVVVVPFGRQYAEHVRNAVLGLKIANLHLVDLGPEAAAGLTGDVAGGTEQSPDGVHPNWATQKALGLRLADELLRIVSPPA